MRVEGMLSIRGDVDGAITDILCEPVDLIDYRQLPAVLASVHRSSSPDDTLVADLVLSPTRVSGAVTGDAAPDLATLLIGAGFEPTSTRTEPQPSGDRVCVDAIRLRSLADQVGPDMAVLICGLNPSLHSADMGVGFGRGGNRFWPAALDAGLVSVDRDPVDALSRHHVGMTDMVKRATPRADSLTTDEYVSGVERLTALCRWLQPGLVCMVGLAGWRAAVDRRATAGIQPDLLGDTPVYVMPSTSGLNARSSLADLTEHLKKASELAAVNDC